MNHLSRNEFIELGVSVPTAPLTAWALKQVAAAKTQEETLRHRGVRPPFLKELATLVEKVGKAQAALGKDKAALPAKVTQAQRTREEAFAFWQESKQIVKAEFGTRPEIQAKFRLGVRTGRLVSHLRHEMECDLALLRVHLEELRWLGVDEAYLAAGATLVGKLKTAQTDIESACRELPPLLENLCFEKGRLYDLTRKLVRIGRLAFIQEPEQAAAFNYDILRKELRAGSEIRTKVASDVAL